MDGLKVLLVGDDEQFSCMLHNYLENLNVTVVGRARNGMQALAYTRMLEPDLVLLNIRMPGMYGVDIARCLRATDPLVKIVFLSVHDNDTYRDVAVSLGFDGFISRRDLMDQLPRAIDMLERRCPARGPDEVMNPFPASRSTPTKRTMELHS